MPFNTHWTFHLRASMLISACKQFMRSNNREISKSKCTSFYDPGHHKPTWELELGGKYLIKVNYK